jgi:hypothetical protein
MPALVRSVNRSSRVERTATDRQLCAGFAGSSSTHRHRPNDIDDSIFLNEARSVPSVPGLLNQTIWKPRPSWTTPAHRWR